jgi:carbon monoxide dehydrogenase subunit G
MSKIELSVVINRPVEEVFAFANDPNNDVQWQTGVLESKQTSEGPRGVGTTDSNVIQFLGRRIESTVEITEYEPNKMVRSKATSGPIPFDSTSTFESVEGGTKVTTEAEMDFGGVFKLAEPIVMRSAKRQFEGSMATLKDILEVGA